MAFRKRLKSVGYRDISIKQVYDEGIPTSEYSVTAVEPLGGTTVRVYFTLVMMDHAFKKYRDTHQQVYGNRQSVQKNIYQQVSFFQEEVINLEGRRYNCAMLPVDL